MQFRTSFCLMESFIFLLCYARLNFRPFFPLFCLLFVFFFRLCDVVKLWEVMRKKAWPSFRSFARGISNKLPLRIAIWKSRLENMEFSSKLVCFLLFLLILSLLRLFFRMKRVLQGVPYEKQSFRIVLANCKQIWQNCQKVLSNTFVINITLGWKWIVSVLKPFTPNF